MTDKTSQNATYNFNKNLASSQYTVSPIPSHIHNGIDTNKIPPTSVTNFTALPANNVTPTVIVSPFNGVISSNNISAGNSPYGIIYPTPIVVGFGAGGGSPNYSIFNGGTALNGSMVAFFNESTRFGQLWIALENPGIEQWTLTGTVAMGATTATLTTNWLRVNGVYPVLFSNKITKQVTFTNGSTAISWTGGLTSSATANINVSLPTQWYGVNLDQFVG